MRRQFLLSFFVLLATVTIALGQDNLGIKYFGLSIHPQGEKENAFLMPRKFDREGYLVLNVGGVASYEKFIIQNRLSIKVAQALYSDCAARTGGFSHVGLRGRIFTSGRHSLFGGIGPTLVYRKNWQELEGYNNPNRFKGEPGNRWQHLFLWYGGEFEYKYQLNEKFDLASSFVPGYPDLMSLSVGLSYRFKKGNAVQ